MSGALGRAAGTNVGAYAINQGALVSTLGYALDVTTGKTLSITPASLTLAASNASKAYDGGLAATATAAVRAGTLFGSDTITGGSFAYTDKSVGSGNKTVTATGVTVNDGNNGANYSVGYANNTTSTISSYAVSLTGSRVYDGTTDVAAGGLTLGTLVGSETLVLSGTGTVTSKNIGMMKSVALGSLALGNGTGAASNYSGVAVTGVTADSKVYDGTTAAFLAGTPGVASFGADIVTVGGGIGVFASASVNTDIPVDASEFTLGGADAGNYTVVQPAGLTASITPLAAIAEDATQLQLNVPLLSRGSLIELPGLGGNERQVLFEIEEGGVRMPRDEFLADEECGDGSIAHCVRYRTERRASFGH